jgi:hypothetical protein
MVKNLTHNPKIEGSNPTTGTVKEIMPRIVIELN